MHGLPLLPFLMPLWRGDRLRINRRLIDGRLIHLRLVDRPRLLTRHRSWLWAYWRITLPMALRPRWFATVIREVESGRVVVLGHTKSSCSRVCLGRAADGGVTAAVRGSIKTAGPHGTHASHHA